MTTTLAKKRFKKFGTGDPSSIAVATPLAWVHCPDPCYIPEEERTLSLHNATWSYRMRFVNYNGLSNLATCHSYMGYCWHYRARELVIFSPRLTLYVTTDAPS